MNYLQTLPFLYQALLDHPLLPQAMHLSDYFFWEFYRTLQLVFDLFRSRKVHLEVYSGIQHITN